MVTTITSTPLPNVDLIIPFFNEERELPLLLDNLAAQVDFEGRPLEKGAFRLILVDNNSTDGSPDIARAFIRDNGAFELLLLHEPVKSHIQSRICGAGYALRPEEKRRFPILANADCDTRLHPEWIQRIRVGLGDGRTDVLTFSGYFSDDFWIKTPSLTRAYFEEVGTIFFGRETIRHFGFAGKEALFTEKVFLDFGRILADCACAVTKDAYERCGGYQRDYWPDGGEILGEGWHLNFRLDLTGARFAYVNDAPYQTSARRLLLEAEKLFAGQSYSSEMSDLRDEPREEQYKLLDSKAREFDFESLRRYVVQNYILLLCITGPWRLAENADYFGEALPALQAEIEGNLAANPRPSSGEIRLFSEALLGRYYETILGNVRSMKNIV